MVRRARHNTHSVHHQQHHYHDHHHHHFHYHHFHHQSSSSANEHQDQDSRTSSAIDNDLPIHPNQINGHQRRLLTNGRTSFLSNSRIGANSQIAAIEARDRLDERLRGIRHMRNRAVLGGFFDNLSFHLGNEEDVCIDDEIWELGIQDWLTTWGYDEPQQMDLFSVPKGLSKSAIRSLPKEYFVPQVPQNNSEVEDAILEQNDCSVCLEHFKVGQVLICLPCKHRFHQECLIPWLESHGQCPYCRAKICRGEAHGQSSRNSLAQQENNDDLLAWLTIS
ncbi:hypothetical protein KP509_27G040900 [Ceratopteris richardii]|nr:hypothetical protein KP509_27G040900 [Ceratopteris richardii]KAH7295275.1 hypothetical protein KP509_27G040900 [Ceratopteris richardii]